jgi:uncharacterized protein
MIFPLKRILLGHSVLVQDVAMTESQIEEAHFTGAVHCRAEIERLTFHIFARISYACGVTLECSRCTEAYEQALAGVFSVTIQHASRRSSNPDENDDSIDLFYSDDDDEIDLRPVLYDEIMTSMPMKPLCRAQCPGLQVEGGERSETAAGIEKGVPADPRWEALKKLKQRS